ncbi:MAG TPA: transcriptional regulator NrdR [Tepidisphaeraceae bacterium]|jgi:transcriptional repressor NrdR|nr:transcriptional regulator NrdR [Tepidisphaeraceae bacterium]
MRCPFCEAEKDSLKVIDSRTCEGGKAIRRRRQCLKCNKRFTTYEKIEQNIRLSVVKKDGRRVPWDQKKIVSGLERACFKRPVPESELQRIADEVEEEVFKTYDREVPSDAVGRLVTERLRRIDQVAYVRFASVYKQFKTLEELVDEAKAVIDARRYEDPSQGRLFTEAADGPRPTDGENGDHHPAKGRAPVKDGPGRRRAAKTAEHKTAEHSTTAVPSEA